MRIVGSLTTIPSRINGIQSNIESILAQAKLDLVYLTIPWYCKKTSQEYIIPDWLHRYPRCQIVRCDDYGPLTKIMGALLEESDPDTIIVTFDDDRVYPSTLVEEMLKNHTKRPNSAIGSCGFQIGTFPFYGTVVMNEPYKNGWWFSKPVPADGLPVDVIGGYSGALYKRKFFPKPRELGTFVGYPLKYKAVYLNDDVYISAWLSRQGIPRYVYTLPTVSESGNSSNGLSDNGLYFYLQLFKAILRCQREGFFANRVSPEWRYTVTGPIIIGLLVLIVLVIVYFSYPRFLSQ